MSGIMIFFVGIFIGLLVALAIWIMGRGVSDIKARDILIKYTDGNNKTVIGTEWEQYESTMVIYNNELENNLVLEVNLSSLKSIEFVKQGEGE